MCTVKHLTFDTVDVTPPIVLAFPTENRQTARESAIRCLAPSIVLAVPNADVSDIELIKRFPDEIFVPTNVSQQSMNIKFNSILTKLSKKMKEKIK